MDAPTPDPVVVVDARQSMLLSQELGQAYKVSVPKMSSTEICAANAKAAKCVKGPDSHCLMSIGKLGDLTWSRLGRL